MSEINTTQQISEINTTQQMSEINTTQQMSEINTTQQMSGRKKVINNLKSSICSHNLLTSTQNYFSYPLSLLSYTTRVVMLMKVLEDMKANKFVRAQVSKNKGFYISHYPISSSRFH